MANVLNISFSSRASILPTHSTSHLQSPSSPYPLPRLSIRRKVRSCKAAKITSLFRDNSKQEQARKALENALDGKLGGEFDKWNKELNKKEEDLARKGLSGGGGGGRGWFRWLGGGGDDHFWQEAQQTGLTVLAILTMYFVITQGDVILATVLNPLLYALRRVRVFLALAASEMMKRISPATYARLQSAEKEQVQTARISAKEKVLKKWG